MRGGKPLNRYRGICRLDALGGEPLEQQISFFLKKGLEHTVLEVYLSLVTFPVLMRTLLSCFLPLIPSANHSISLNKGAMNCHDIQFYKQWLFGGRSFSILLPLL